MSASLDVVITDTVWVGSQSLQVTFVSHHTDRHHQLYAGRKLVGVTSRTDERTITGHVVPTASPCPLQIVAITADLLGTDYGDSLPVRPYNKHQLRWAADGLEADTERFGVFIPTEFAGDPETLHLCVPSTGDGNYAAEVPAVDQSGDWTYAVQPIDDAAGDDPIIEGNYGDATEITVRAKVYPPDLALNADRTRFTATAQDGTLTLRWAYDWSAS
jgi:hypothetical protein